MEDIGQGQVPLGDLAPIKDLNWLLPHVIFHQCPLSGGYPLLTFFWGIDMISIKDPVEVGSSHFCFCMRNACLAHSPPTCHTCFPKDTVHILLQFKSSFLIMNNLSYDWLAIGNSCSLVDQVVGTSKLPQTLYVLPLLLNCLLSLLNNWRNYVRIR